MSKFIAGTTSSPLFAARYRVSARDRRRAAVHEAGHVVVARHLGVRILQAEIRKIEPQDLTEKERVGSVRCMTEGVLASKSKVVAVAGLVAEACWYGEIFDELYGALESNPEEMSQSDWDLSGCPSGEPSKQFSDAMEQAFELLNRETGKLWKALLVEARGLIVRSRQDAAPFMHPVKGGSSGLAP
jgi:hypothetical protein